MDERPDNDGPPFLIDGMPCDLGDFPHAEAVKFSELPVSAAPFPRVVRQQTPEGDLIAYWLYAQPDAPPRAYSPKGQLEPAP